ncbi:hypothetical protein BDZ94DRAFT_1261459 [Collybia nuda]|uniref:SMP-30/Gluconolactonase/LRE-like region domain-containing protein n=1 Tax=Collybia nuda TaxID=64659 RepID=A0A9P6CHN2_9AGAR|nr:hypothetical protein BDZ94DRAFT_1261459 [Collybia nuda]
MGSTLFTISVVLLSILVGIYQFSIKPKLDVFGVGRAVEPVGTRECVTVPDVQACEKIVLHQPTGILYLACSTPSSRTHWVPSMDQLNATGASFSDYVATYNPKNKRITRLEISNYNSYRGLSLHGMDVVPSSSNSKELFVYLINHRAPLGGREAPKVGADTSIEIFKTSTGSPKLVHQATIEDSLLISPNDVVGSPDGKSLYFTNDIGKKTGIARSLLEFWKPSSSIVYCDIERGCKYSASNMLGNNGITKGKNDTFYVANARAGQLRVMEVQADNTLVLTDVISTDRPIDNVSVDEDGVVWAAGFPKTFAMLEYMRNLAIPPPSSALKFAINTGPAAFYGEKFKVEKAFEDDGALVPGATTVVHDSLRGLLFFHGICAPWLTVCQYKK